MKEIKEINIKTYSTNFILRSRNKNYLIVCVTNKINMKPILFIFY